MLSALFGVGLYVSWVNIRVRRVPNIGTYSLVVLGLVGQVVMIWLQVISPEMLVGIFFAGLTTGLGLTFVGIWGPGDGKLFWGAVVAMPPSLYASREWLAIESVWAALLVNSLLSYVFALLVVPFWRKEQERFPTAAMSIRQALRVLTAYAAILGLALGFTSLVLQRPLIYLEGLIAMFVGYRILESDVLRIGLVSRIRG